MRVISKVIAATALFVPMVFGAISAQAQDRADLVSGTYVPDPTHSSIMFVSNHLGLSTFVGRFNEYSATLNVDAGDISASTLEVSVKVASIDIDLPLFVEHMSSSDWFDVEKHPEVTFVATSFDPSSATGGTITGNLTLHGVTKPITLQAKLVGMTDNHPMAGVPAFGIEARGTVTRSEFGMEAYIPMIPDDVELWITIEFHKQG